MTRNSNALGKKNKAPSRRSGGGGLPQNLYRNDKSSRLTLSPEHVLPLVTSSRNRVHALLLRMRPKERLCFHGKIRVRVYEGAVEVNGALLEASQQYHTLLSPFSSSALVIRAVATSNSSSPSSASVQQKESGDKSRKRKRGERRVVAVEDDAEDEAAVRDLLRLKREQSSRAKEQEAETKEEGEEVVLILKSALQEKKQNRGNAKSNTHQSKRLTCDEVGDDEEEDYTPNQYFFSVPMVRRLFLDEYLEREANAYSRDDGDGGSGSDSDERSNGPIAGYTPIDENQVEENEVVEDGGEGSGAESRQDEAVVEEERAEEIDESRSASEPQSGDLEHTPRKKRQVQIIGDDETEIIYISDDEDGNANNDADVSIPVGVGYSIEDDADDTSVIQEPVEAVMDVEKKSKQKRSRKDDSPPAPHLFFRIPCFYPIFPNHAPNAQPLLLSSAWKGLVRTLCSASAQPSFPIILICGAKHTGKSTFGQFLVNSLLRQHSAVAFLDTDLGQPEFTPPGLISLLRIKKPIFGPAWAHMAPPLKSYYVGDSTVEDSPDLYLDGIYSLFDHYLHNLSATMPLVINTHGWIKGLGYEMLLSITRHIKPTHIVNTYSPSEHISNPYAQIPLLATFSSPPIEDNFASSPVYAPSTYALPSFSLEPPKVSIAAADARTLRLLAYFSCKAGEGHITSQIPYQIPWQLLRVKVMNADVPASQVMYSLNASIVALCADDTPYQVCNADFVEESSPYPTFLTTIPLANCLGLGIVRGIDPDKHLFYVSTPIPLTRLEQVNTLLRGELQVPTFMHAQKVSSPFLFELVLFVCFVYYFGGNEETRALAK
ncbi:Polynucleotide 5'-hydroxyl-kinase grc3, variant 2 [Balamuthia mandrillaris]